MTHTWTHRLFALLAVATLLLAACANDKNSSATKTVSAGPTAIPVTAAPAFPVSVTRSDGKSLSVPQVPARVASLSPGATEILYVIGAEASLVAVDKDADYPDAAKNFATKVDAFKPNIESIAALKPDLVIVASDTGGIVAKLDELKIPVYYIDLNKDVQNIDDVFSQIILLGRVTGKSDKAQSVVADLGDRRTKVTLAIRGTTSQNAPRVYHELDDTFYSASTGSFVGDIYATLHMTNIAGDGRGVAYPQLTQEAIIAANPQLIILADEAFGVSVDSVEARPGWSVIEAVKNNKIFAIDPNIISRPGPRIIDALEMLAKDAYPDLVK
ncbi:MAG: ABC transporter substrate-binding protein [Chloroflexota bacterium]|nr:ABC transporter substrate-binding protein [Chloroflexota bacterium]